jgi:predicted metalloprotease
MRWQGRRQSKNVEDRRSLGRDVAVGGGLLTLLIMGAALFFPDLVPVLKLFEAPP